MTNEEIRLLIAQTMGWEDIVYRFTYSEGMNTPFGTSPKGISYSQLPNWPISIANAWQLLEEMAVGLQGFTITSEHYGSGQTTWRASEYADPYDGDCEQVGIVIRDDSAPRAICLAWLEWKKSQGK
jgi:hypothetical protein